MPEGIGAVNDFHVKLVKLRGEFVWHSHDVEDELFLVLVVLLVAIGLVLLTRHAAAATVVGLTQPTVFAAGV